VKQRAIKSLEIVILEKICESRRGRKSKLNKTIKLLLNCDALNLIRLIKNNRKRGEKGEKSWVKFWRGRWERLVMGLEV
jgi:hypothetical protein